MESELEELAWLGDWAWLTVGVPIHPKDVPRGSGPHQTWLIISS